MKQSEFKKRRKQLMQSVGKGNIALIGSASMHTRNRDVDFPFRQDSDFYYLTGFNEPDALAVFIPGREKGEYILFCREFDEKKALWEGAHSGLEGATAHYEADDSFPIDDLDDILPVCWKTKRKFFIRWDMIWSWIIACWNGSIISAVSPEAVLWHLQSWFVWTLFCMRCACLKVLPN